MCTVLSMLCGFTHSTCMCACICVRLGHTDPLLHETRETPDFCITCYFPVALFPDSPPPTQDPGNKVACPPEVVLVQSGV